jgi:hypothetical protein
MCIKSRPKNLKIKSVAYLIMLHNLIPQELLSVGLDDMFIAYSKLVLTI